MTHPAPSAAAVAAAARSRRVTLRPLKSPESHRNGLSSGRTEGFRPGRSRGIDEELRKHSLGGNRTPEVIIFVLILHIVKKRIHINMLRNDLESFLQTSRELEQHVFDVVSKLVTTRTSQEDPPMTPKPDPEKTSSGHAISLVKRPPLWLPLRTAPFSAPWRWCWRFEAVVTGLWLGAAGRCRSSGPRASRAGPARPTPSKTVFSMGIGFVR